MAGEGETYRPSARAADSVSIAVAAYKDFGRQSAPGEFRALAQSGYVSRVTESSGEKVSTQSADHAPRRGAHTRSGTGRAEENEAPVFVLGNQKSGSTAIAALLSACIGGTLISDVLYRNSWQLGDLLGDESALADVARTHPEAFRATVVKDNDFTFLFPSVVRAFPRASFVFVVRDPRQNIRSILNRLNLPGNLGSLSAETYADLRESLPGWFDILTGSAFNSEVGHYIDVLADRWVRANQVYAGSNRMTLVRYEDFDAAKRPVIERLATELGFPVESDISELQDRQFQPRGDRSVTPEAFFGSENLERVERRCATLMASFGYETTR